MSASVSEETVLQRSLGMVTHEKAEETDDNEGPQQNDERLDLRTYEVIDSLHHDHLSIP